VGALKDSGFRTTDISFLTAENVGSKDFGHRKSTKAPEGAVVGAVSGVLAGGTLGYLEAAGTVSVPLLMSLSSGGPWNSFFAVAGVLGIVGGVVGALIGLDIPEYEAKRYEGRKHKGGILLSVHCDDAQWAERARKILSTTAAEG